MANDNEPDGGIRHWTRWATTRPQAYLTYLIALILIWLVSYYAGTLNPKKAPPPAMPGPVIAPHN
jgi:hypothetical protein